MRRFFRNWRNFYGINRETWPEMSRFAAALDGGKLAWHVQSVP